MVPICVALQWSSMALRDVLKGGLALKQGLNPFDIQQRFLSTCVNISLRRDTKLLAWTCSQAGPKPVRHSTKVPVNVS